MSDLPCYSLKMDEMEKKIAAPVMTSSFSTCESAIIITAHLNGEKPSVGRKVGERWGMLEVANGVSPGSGETGVFVRLVFNLHLNRCCLWLLTDLLKHRSPQDISSMSADLCGGLSLPHLLSPAKRTLYGSRGWYQQGWNQPGTPLPLILHRSLQLEASSVSELCNARSGPETWDAFQPITKVHARTIHHEQR